ncbi:hypothetical protein R3P38DRAFT_795099 [Favolaschia claudopus]|uniref:Uncharacterized protein n=1 Tax=Favolaschia claudopus TaxID=2862362 RepID=A0AAW0C2Q0_9AGAR
MSSNNRSSTDRVASKPIPIGNSPFPRGRPRSLSVSSGESSGSASSPNEIPTPMSSSATSPRISASPGTSPILSYFFAQSPSAKTPGGGTFPFRKFGPPPVFEGTCYLPSEWHCNNIDALSIEEEPEARDLPAVSHARRASTAVAGRFAQTPSTAIPDAHAERGQGLLRRLSLSTNFMPPMDGKHSPPNAPPNTAVSPTQDTPFSTGRSPRRAATLSAGEGRPRRAPSPMGERILKGHFDGFN